MHNLIHVLFRAWCRECVLGRGRDRYHRQIVGSDDVARIATVYMLLSEYSSHRSQDEADKVIEKEGGQFKNCMTVLVIKDFKHKSIWAYPVEGKGMMLRSGSSPKSSRTSTLADSTAATW